MRKGDFIWRMQWFGKYLDFQQIQQGGCVMLISCQSFHYIKGIKLGDVTFNTLENPTQTYAHRKLQIEFEDGNTVEIDLFASSVDNLKLDVEKEMTTYLCSSDGTIIQEMSN